MRRPSLQSVTLRSVQLLLLWWALTDGDPSAWLFGVPIVLVALAASFRLQSSTDFTVWGLLLFLPGFFLSSLRAASEVTRMAFSPRLPLTPSLLHYPLRLPPGPARVFFMNVVSLQPGTLSVQVGDRNELTVHALDGQHSHQAALERLESAVARIFSLSLHDG